MVELTVSVLLLVAGVVAMLVLHILIVVWALRRGVVLRAAASRRQDDEERAPGLSAEDLNELPCHDHECGGKLAASGGAGAGAECAVCLEAFQAGDRCRVLPRCEHGFHAHCVDQWLRKSRVCPVCRAEVAGGGGGGGGKTAGASSASAVVTERQGAADR